MVSAEAFERLANRPPTPPKDHDKALEDQLDQAIHFLDVDLGSLERATEPELPTAETPAQPSPPSSQENGTNPKSTRRVEFSPCVTTHDPQPTYATASPIPRRFPSSRQLRPIKSILKATLDLQTPTPDGATSPGRDYFSISDPKTFPVMLESVLKLLAAPSTPLRQDGYTTLNGALKAYDDLPDAEALRSKMPQLVQFMTRDISDYGQSTSAMEATLTTQALKLATAILMNHALEDSLDERFQTLLVDRSIEIIEQDPVPKAIANHHMYLLATQRFSPRIITTAKAERIIASLVTVHNRVSGNSVIAARLVIFLRLLEKAPSVMLTTIREWIPHVFHGVLSSIKDIRGRALDTGNQAAMILGTQFQATKTIIDLFNTSTSEEGEYGNYFIARLSDMTSQKSLVENVPQIWSMIILFFKSRKQRLIKWHLFKSFLLVIQKCLNSPDIGVKYGATLAWNRLVYVLDPDRENFQPTSSLVNMLRVPFVVAFENRRGQDKNAKESRKIALNGYCNLLHYALRPSQSHEDLDFFWDEYVHNVLSKLLRSGGKDANVACRVLKALFDSKVTVWDEKAAFKTQMLPEALPRLDPRWVRSRSKRVIDLIGPFLALSLSQQGDGSGIASTPWREFMTAIAGAGSQEVRVSIELKECLANLMNFLSHLWSEASKNFKESTDGMWIERFASLVQCSIEVIGSLHFGEANLVRNNTEELEAVPTPSHRTSKHHDIWQSSAVVLYGLFTNPPVSIKADTDYFGVARNILHQICQGRPSRRSRLELVRQCAQATSTSKLARLWVVAAQEATSTLLDPSLDETTQEAQRLGQQIRDAVSILALGLHYDDGEVDTLSPMFELISVMAKILKQEAGDGAIAIGLMEPVAEALLQQVEQNVPRHIFVQCATKVLQEGAIPRSRHQIDEARKLLWNPTFLQQSKQTHADPFNHVYALVKRTFSVAYGNVDECASYLADFSEAVRGFLLKFPLSQVGPALRQMQSEISLVVKDDGRVLASNNKDTKKASLKILELWLTILDRVRELPSNTTLLRALEALFSAGLNSSHRAIINATVSFWNSTFGRLDSLDYPPGVELAIRKLQPLVELDLPNFPTKPSDSAPSPLKDLVESQENANTEEVPTPTRRTALRKSQRLSASSRKAPTPARTVTVTTHKQPTPKPASKAKLRHDDSQIEFTAVESSSPVAELDSQLLTEHQREVNSRQRFETAPMYPEFSSSPAQRSVSSGLALPKLDFLRQEVTDTGFATPTLHEEHGPMDDYVTSSPTPKASRFQAPRAPEVTEQGPQPDVDDSDIPSSPPQIEDDTGYDNGGDAADNHEENQVVADTFVGEQQVPDPGPKTGDAKPNSEDVDMDSEKSIEQNPDIALQNGQEEADPLQTHPSLQRLRQVNEGGTSSDVYQDAQSGLENETKEDEQTAEEKAINDEATKEAEDSGRSNSSSPMHYNDSFSKTQANDMSMVDETTIGVELESALVEGDFSRVEDSFAGSISAEEVIDVGAPPKDSTPRNEQRTSLDLDASQDHPPMSGSKRKRDEDNESQTSAKRRKSKSPFKRIMSMVWPQKEEPEQEEEMGDYINVGSYADEQEEMPPPDSPQETPDSEPAPVSVPETRPKRGRGRPRKSDTPPTTTAVPIAATNAETNSSPVFSIQTRAAKRRASTLRGEESDMSQSSIIADTPAPTKSRRMTRSQDAKTGPASEHVELPTKRSYRARKLEGVVIPTSVTKATEEQQPISEASSVPANSSQVHEELQREEEPQAEENPEAEAEAEDENDEEVSQEVESQLRQEQALAAAARNSRIFARPKSIIDRLRVIISECKSMVMGPQEEREVHDVLFELGTEVFNARKRSGL